MGHLEFKEGVMQPVLTFKTARDSRNRVTLRGKDLAEFYEVDLFPDGEIRMRPRILAAPAEVVSAQTQQSIASAVDNARKGRVGGIFDPDKYKALLADEPGE
jgi:hypothetical protein